MKLQEGSSWPLQTTQGSGASIQPSSCKKSGTPDVGSASISKRIERLHQFESDYNNVDSDSDIEILHSVADITSTTVENGEASLRIVSAPTAFEQTGNSLELLGLQPRAIH
jgi:hypothetical protein